jgi:murein DD-endopeptidase MepM/ murein hydrolase activator NlpD
MAHKPTEHPVVTCKYGTKNHGNIIWAAGYHTGTDYAASWDDPIFAVLEGRIIHVGRFGGWGPAYGIHVLIQTGDMVIGYCHLSSINLKNGIGHILKEGDLVGKAGASGKAHGVHLHLEARKAPYRYDIDTIDPETLFSHPSHKPVKKAPAKKAPAKP